MHHNPRRGEIAAQLGGRSWRLCLTLGALAELEAALDVPDLLALAERFEKGRLSARDIIAVLAAGMRGAGHEVSDEQVAAMASADGVPGYAAIVARLLAATFPATQEGPDDAAAA